VRFDAAIGWFLKGDGKGSFESIDVNQSGFFVRGDAKSQANLFVENQELTISSINNGNLKIHATAYKSQQTYTAKKNDIAAIIQFENGIIQKRAFHYGSGYLSQGSRKLLIPRNATSVRILDTHGKETEILSVE